MKGIFLLILSGFILSTGYAQTKPQPKAKPVITNYKTKTVPPVLNIIWNGYRDSAVVMADEAKMMLTKPFFIVDGKKGKYTISSFQFVYQEMATVEQEDGSRKPSFHRTIKLFRSSPIPENWINSISETLKKGDEIFFFDVIAKDAEGKVMYASNFKLKVI